MRPIVACLILVLAGCKVAPPPLVEADKTAIRAQTDSFVASMKLRRDSASAAHYTENATVMPPNAGIAEGRAAIRAWLEAFPPLTEFSLTPVEVDGRGDLAYERGTYAFTIAAASGKPATSDHGKYLVIKRRQPGGTWLVSVDIFNSDLPATTTPSR
jgi:ketosteroid isomerase-like protein